MTKRLLKAILNLFGVECRLKSDGTTWAKDVSYPPDCCRTWSHFDAQAIMLSDLKDKAK